MTPLRVVAALAVYGALLVLVLRLVARPGDADQRRTYLAVAGAWAVSVLAASHALYLAGVMSFPPWVTICPHGFVWIGVCLTAMYHHFLHVLQGNSAYLIGWSLADGPYPVLTPLGLRHAGRRVPGLMPV